MKQFPAVVTPLLQLFPDARLQVCFLRLNGNRSLDVKIGSLVETTYFKVTDLLTLFQDQGISPCPVLRSRTEKSPLMRTCVSRELGRDLERRLFVSCFYASREATFWRTSRSYRSASLMCVQCNHFLANLQFSSFNFCMSDPLVVFFFLSSQYHSISFFSTSSTCVTTMYNTNGGSAWYNKADVDRLIPKTIGNRKRDCA